MIFELQEIVKYFDQIKAVDSISLSIREGEVLGLVGPNGSGKSTLLKIMLGIIRPSSGKLLVNGEELTENGWKQFRKKVGYMPESVSFYDNLTGKETLHLFARIKGRNIHEIYGLIKKIVLEEALDRKVGGYSKGMRQRLNLAQALLNDPEILILDEPTTGLDPVGTREFYQILDEVKARKNLTVILSSHVLAELEDKTDRVAIIKNGLLKAVGSLEELYTGLKLPLRIFVAFYRSNGGYNGSPAESIEELLKNEGIVDIRYKEGYLIASIPRENKLRILSALMTKRNSFDDLIIREPSLEEVFFGFH